MDGADNPSIGKYNKDGTDGSSTRIPDVNRADYLGTSIPDINRADNLGIRTQDADSDGGADDLGIDKQPDGDKGVDDPGTGGVSRYTDIRDRRRRRSG